MFVEGVPSRPPASPYGREPAAVGPQLEGRLVGLEAVVADERQAAAEHARAAGVGHVAVLRG